MAILDEESLLASCAYIDLNPVAAGIAAVPEASKHTSIKQRVDHVKAQGRTKDLKAARKGSVAGCEALAGLEESHWLCPIEDRRRLGSSREGMLEGFSLGNYLLLVDYTGRLFRDGKAVISRGVAEILDRLGSSVEHWQARLEKLSKGYLYGRFFAASRQRLRELAQRRGVRRVTNLGGCPLADKGNERGDGSPKSIGKVDHAPPAIRPSSARKIRKAGTTKSAKTAKKGGAPGNRTARVRSSPR